MESTKHRIIRTWMGSLLVFRSFRVLFFQCSVSSCLSGLSLRAVTPVTAELSGCYRCCKSPLYIVLSVYSQIVTGVHTQVRAD